MKWQIVLADDWQRLHKKGTVIFSATVGALIPLAEIVRQTWGFLPDDLKEYLPHSLKQAISYTVLCCAFLAFRYTSVQKKDGQNDAQ